MPSFVLHIVCPVLKYCDFENAFKKLRHWLKVIHLITYHALRRVLPLPLTHRHTHTQKHIITHKYLQTDMCMGDDQACTHLIPLAHRNTSSGITEDLLPPVLCIYHKTQTPQFENRNSLTSPLRPLPPPS